MISWQETIEKTNALKNRAREIQQGCVILISDKKYIYRYKNGEIFLFHYVDWIERKVKVISIDMTLNRFFNRLNKGEIKLTDEIVKLLF